MAKDWTEDELIYLEHFLYNQDKEKLYYSQTQEILKHPMSSIYTKASLMRLENENFGYLHKPLSDREVRYIKHLFPTHTVVDIAKALNRSEYTIYKKTQELGLKKYVRLANYDKEIRLLADEGKYISQIARALGLRPSSISYYIKKHNIECRRASREEQGAHFSKMNELHFKRRDAYLKRMGEINGDKQNSRHQRKL